MGYLFTAAPAKLLLALDEGYLLTAALPDLERGVAPLRPPVPVQPLLLGLHRECLKIVNSILNKVHSFSSKLVGFTLHLKIVLSI